MAVTVVCGAECGIVTSGLNTQSQRHWGGIAGAPAIETSTVLNGARAFRFAAAATRPYLTHNPPASSTVIYARIYFRFTDATPASDWYLFTCGNATANTYVYLQTGGTLRFSVAGSDTLGSITHANDTWYGIEFESNCSANPHTGRWRLWSAAGGWVDQTDASGAAVAAAGYNNIDFGETSATGPTSGNTLYVDDCVFGAGTTSDVWSTTVPRHTKCLRLLPTADLTHAFNDNDFEYNDTTGIDNAATDIYTYLDDSDQTVITDFISQNVAGAGKLISCSFGDSAEVGSVGAVQVLSTHHSAGTGANEMHLRVSDDGATWTNVWGDWAAAGKDTSDTTAQFLRSVLSTKPTGGAWTIAALNTMRFQWGNSDDASAIPYLDNISLEYDVTYSTSASAGAASATGAAANTSETVKPFAGLVSVTGESLAGSPSPQPFAGLVSVTGAAAAVLPNVGALGDPGQAFSTGAALDVTATLTTPAGHVAITGEAFDGFIPEFFEALAGHATVSASASVGEGSDIDIALEHIAVIGEAFGPPGSTFTSAGHAALAAAAYAVAPLLAPGSGLASPQATAVAFDHIGLSANADVSVSAGHASATVITYDVTFTGPSGSITATVSVNSLTLEVVSPIVITRVQP